MLFFSLFLFASIQACTPEPDPTPTPTPVNRYGWDTLALGGDLSYVNIIERLGGQYYDNGKKSDPFDILYAHGGNTVRVRLWHSPNWQSGLSNGDYYSDLADAERTISRAKAAGMAVLLDFHYSDTWADPSKQYTPLAWSGLNLTTLGDSVYRYTSEVLHYLAAKNLTPEMVQIGNETNAGMLHPQGRINGGNFDNFATLLNRGIAAVRDFSTSSNVKPRIVLHVAQVKNAVWFIQGVIGANTTDFDILGLSHYENWADGYSLAEVESIIRQITTQYNRKVIVVETACPWSNQNADSYGNIISGQTAFAGYPVTAQGQHDYLAALTQAVVNGGGSGVIYWEPAWITSSLNDSWGTGSAWDNCALFDFSGKSLKGLDFMSYSYAF